MQLFSNIQSELINRIVNSKKGLQIAVTWFTNHELYNAIIKKLETPNFNLELIVLNDRINNKKEGVNFQKLIDLKAKFYYSNVENMVHHKFCIIDNEIVITGSYNWTYYAENRNWENVLISDDSQVVKNYVEEFERIKSVHKLVETIAIEERDDISINFNDYLETDYIYQAKAEEKKGNDLGVAKIYTELLKINNKQSEIISARNKILQKYNSKKFEVAPFEIGILFKDGYITVIPAFSKLPFTFEKNGKTSVDKQTGILVTIQKNDYIKKNILQISLNNIKPSPAGTSKIKHTITLKNDGQLTVHCKELDGYGRTNVGQINIKDCL
ncbi:phospholipase D-like domain-containing protein [Flavobacterium sp. LM4]|uniref:phospholipase D-like domain-containing protein n=1 Tax=Flavobacterium sp. LM4 TaxID=1938609 RepID=UPI0009CF3473|nr:phospholipase D-like domain-containing protein [Flavobacterium sp. LM4]OOV19548.1 hypothetical protein BXU10_07820 [Flavobacterium sp. LM4]